MPVDVVRDLPRSAEPVEWPIEYRGVHVVAAQSAAPALRDSEGRGQIIVGRFHAQTLTQRRDPASTLSTAILVDLPYTQMGVRRVADVYGKSTKFAACGRKGEAQASAPREARRSSSSAEMQDSMIGPRAPSIT